jgi:hypothetical protein
MVFTTPITDETIAEFLDTPGALSKLHKDLRDAADTMSAQEIRYIVDTYYTVQNYRLRSANQIRALSKSEEPVALLEWIQAGISDLEKEITKWMLRYASSSETGQWALSICGIGPVIAAGMLAHLDMTKTTNINKWWAFAGFDPTKTWQKGQKRPWNAKLKVLGYKAGESFVKVQNNKNDVYGQLFVEKKRLYTARNAAGVYSDRAEQILATKKFGDDTDAKKHYSEGKLPPAHIHAMARRWTIKIFMSHLWQIAYEETYKTVAPNPWILEPGLGGHVDRINVPNHTCPYGANH